MIAPASDTARLDAPTAVILIVNPTPALQHVYRFSKITHNEVNRAIACETLASGKGLNCARAAKAMRGNAVTLAFSGGATGECLTGLACNEHLIVVSVPTVSATRTCTTLIEEQTGEVTELIENAGHVTDEEVQKFVTNFDRILPEFSVLVCIGTLPAGCPDHLYAGMITKARELGIPTIVDTQREALLQAAAAGPTIVKPNRREILDLFNSTADTEEQVRANAERLLELGAEYVLVTNGSLPAIMFSKNEIHIETPPPITVRNPIGSGDSVAAGLAVGIMQRMPICSAADEQDALRHGLIAGQRNAAGDGYGLLQRLNS